MSGDPNQYFTIDTRSGEIRTATVVDYETTSSVLLNVQAQSGNPPTFGHAQVRSSHSRDKLVHKFVHIMAHLINGFKVMKWISLFVGQHKYH